jgi:hypothetical protein
MGMMDGWMDGWVDAVQKAINNINFSHFKVRRAHGNGE